MSAYSANNHQAPPPQGPHEGAISDLSDVRKLPPSRPVAQEPAIVCFFERRFSIPADVQTIDDFRLRVMREQLHRLREEMSASVDLGLGRLFGESGDLCDHRLAVQLAFEELVANALLHGMLGLDSNQARICQIASMGSREEGAQVAALVNERLASGQPQSKEGLFSVELREDKIIVRISDGGMFSDFEERWHVAQTEIPDVHRYSGRGLFLIAALYKEGRQLPDGTLIFQRSLLQ